MPTFQTGNSLRDTSGRAVDGRKSDLSKDGDQCVVSADNSGQAFVYVDLGGIRSIERVLIYLMTGNQEWGKETIFVLKIKHLLPTEHWIDFTSETEHTFMCSNDACLNKSMFVYHLLKNVNSVEGLLNDIIIFDD